MLDLDAAIKQALKSKDHAALTAFRAVKAKAMNKLTEPGRGTDKPLTEPELTALVQREIKERNESNEYLKPDHPDHQENARIIEVLSDYVPKALDGEALEAVIRKAIADSGAAGPKDMGKVMGALKSRFAGQMDMSKASGLVKDLLK